MLWEPGKVGRAWIGSLAANLIGGYSALRVGRQKVFALNQQGASRELLVPCYLLRWG